MNWIDGGKIWGLIRNTNLDGIWGDYKKHARDIGLISFEEKDNYTVSRYSNDRLSAVVERFFKDNGTLCERYTLKNISNCDLFLEQNNCGITVPFTDRYTDAEECMRNCLCLFSDDGKGSCAYISIQHKRRKGTVL